MKSFIPLESNPQVFTTLSKNLGLKDLEFQDVLGFDDTALSWVSRPVHGLVLVFPVDKTETQQPYTASGEESDIVWYPQTIHNACGLYGILHALSNGKARDYLVPGSPLAKILEAARGRSPDERVELLESSQELEAAHTAAAKTGQSTVPESADVEVDYHYIAFTRDNVTGHVYELDGGKKGPVKSNVVLKNDEDLLHPESLNFVRTYIDRQKDGNIGFNLLALAPSS